MHRAVAIHHLFLCSLITILIATPLSAQGAIFGDDFESGDLSAWSSAIGGVSCAAGLPAEGLLGGDLGPAPAGNAAEITCVTFRNDQPFERRGEVAYGGIPLPRGLDLRTTDGLVLIGPGERRLAGQFEVLSRWGGPPDDASLPIRWLQVITVPRVAAQSDTDYGLRRYDSLPAAADPFAATVTPSGGTYEVDTGLATFTLDPSQPALFQAIAIDLDDDGIGRTPIYSHSPGAGPRLTFAGAAGDVSLSTATAGQVRVDAGGFEIVEQGPVKVVVMVRGHFSAPGGASLCTRGGLSYERFGYSLVATFVRGSRDVLLQYQFRNECSDALGGSWTDDAITVRLAAWDFPLALGTSTVFHAGGGAVGASPPGFSGLTVVEQRKGGGTPWARRARVRSDATTLESGEAFARPLAAVADDTVVGALQMPWMRFREPQALAVAGSTLSLRVVSESLVVGEGKGLWNVAQLSLTPTSQALAVGSLAAHLEDLRLRGTAALEHGLLPHAPLPHINASGLYPSLGTTTPSGVKSAYLDLMNTLHQETVSPGGQWDRAKTYGSQLWPDVQYDAFGIDNANPYVNNGAMNYWNASGAELLEFLRDGDPRWVWDFALPQSRLQMHSAYLNLGDHNHGNRNGVAVQSGGTGEGQWHRSAQGSDDYSYNLGMQLAYALRPSPALRQRFAQAGRMLVDRYSIPWVDQASRDPFVNAVDVSRQNIQHFEMLANCAEFVPGAQGQACHDRLLEILEELAFDNLRPGALCGGDIPSTTVCGQPQQFMQSALMSHFFHRMLRNYGDFGGWITHGLVEGARAYYREAMPKLGDGVSLDLDADWAALLECTLVSGGTALGTCTWLSNSDGNALLGHNRPHTAATLLTAHQLDPSLGLCAIARAAFGSPTIYGRWQDNLSNNAGWWKATAQMMQGVVFGLGVYDTCSDP